MKKFSNEQAVVYLKNYNAILDTMISSMTMPIPSDSISRTFILQMIPHHLAAIEMSLNLLHYNVSPALEKVAGRIISEQTESINKMRRALKACGEQTNCVSERADYRQRYEEITDTMFLRMLCACTNDDIEADFIREMIPHHEGALEMCESVLDFEICPELMPIIHTIVLEQGAGVRELRKILSRL